MTDDEIRAYNAKLEAMATAVRLSKLIVEEAEQSAARLRETIKGTS